MKLSCLLHGQIVQNVWHFRVSTSPDLTEMEAVETMFNDWVTGPYALSNSQDLTFVEFSVTDLNTATGIEIVHSLDNIPGEITSPVKSNQDTFCIKLNTALRGRSFRGRTYVLAVATNLYADANSLSSSSVTTLVGHFTTLITDSGIAGHPLGVLSRYSGVDANGKPIPRAAGLLTDVISATATDNIIDSQNRRLPGRGR